MMLMLMSYLPILPLEEESLSFLLFPDNETPLFLSSSSFSFEEELLSTSFLLLLSRGSGFALTGGFGSQAARRSRTLLVLSKGAGGGTSSSPSPPSGLPLEEVNRSLPLDELKCRSSLEETDFWSCSRALGALTGGSGFVLPEELVVVGGEGEDESSIRAGASPPPSTGEEGESGEETEPRDSLLSCLLY